jgi:hypothetical protein
MEFFESDGMSQWNPVTASTVTVSTATSTMNKGKKRIEKNARGI